MPENNFKKPFLKTIFENSYQTWSDFHIFGCSMKNKNQI